MAMMGLILMAFTLRIYHLGYQSLWRDEVDAIRFSDGSIIELVQAMTRVGHNGPLYYVMLRGWRALTGDSEFALRYLSLVGGVFMIAMTYRVCRRFTFDYMTAFLTTCLMTTSPYLIWYSQEAKMYTWLPSLVLVSVYAYKSALWENKTIKWWIIFVIATSLSFYIHILSPLMLGVYIVWAILQWEHVKPRLKGWMIAMGSLTLPYLPLVIWQGNTLLTTTDLGHQFYPFMEQMQLLTHFYSHGVIKSDYSIYFIIIAFTLIYFGFMANFGGQDINGPVPTLRHRSYILLWLVIPVFAIYIISLRIPIFEDRYLIYVVPSYYMLMALGLVALIKRFHWGMIIIFLIVITNNIFEFDKQTHAILKADFRRVATYIAQASEPSPYIIFQMPYLEYTFRYYFPDSYHAIEGPWTNNDKPKEDLAQEMTELTQDVKIVWFVVSEETTWDERQLTRAWLNEHGILLNENQFIGVEVYQYILGE